MKAVVLNGITPAKQVTLSEVNISEVRPGWVLVKVKAFGMNHSEQILRLHEIENDYIQKPIIPGIECVGEIVDSSDSHFEKEEKVVALMGGMGREFHGSYAPTHEVMDRIFSFIREHNLHPCVGAEYDFSRIKEACVALDSGKINGKIVINMS